MSSPTSPELNSHRRWTDAVRRARRRIQSSCGFTLIETMIAAFVLVVALMGAFVLLDAATKISAATRAREGATNLAREVTEDARSIPFSELSPSNIESKLQAMNGLANQSGGSQWQIVRRGYTYTVAV